MEIRNQTSVTNFILLGLTDNSWLKVPLFVIFLLVYTITLMGNINIIILICTSPRLDTPMYFLLSNLSFIDICYSTTITPNMLANFLSKTKTISFLGCATQFYFFAILAHADDLMLTVMAYDRYAAICYPLRYPIIMTKRVCVFFVAGIFITSFLAALVHTSCTFSLTFCGPNEISHFYCDVPPLLKLSCSDTMICEIVLFTVGGGIQVGSFLVVFISYTYIISTIIRMPSTEGRFKAFSTCASHFICVAMFYIPIFFMYLRPRSNYSLDHDRVASLFYTVITPMLNPLIYSLRNKEVKGALKHVIEKLPMLKKNYIENNQKEF
ncbi:olfactory receptor 5AR1-like [Ambystoma mexicanum]|uniref:olfactory receptor 5AR1-like n=1 Tax=Ambystoma mexicanum TaxID=8296 RepID=UPI0037E7F58F